MHSTCFMFFKKGKLLAKSSANHRLDSQKQPLCPLIAANPWGPKDLWVPEQNSEPLPPKLIELFLDTRITPKYVWHLNIKYFFSLSLSISIKWLKSTMTEAHASTWPSEISTQSRRPTGRGPSCNSQPNAHKLPSESGIYSQAKQ